MRTSLHYQRTGGSLLAQDPWGGEGGEGPTGVLVGSRSGDQASTVLRLGKPLPCDRQQIRGSDHYCEGSEGNVGRWGRGGGKDLLSE